MEKVPPEVKDKEKKDPIGGCTTYTGGGGGATETGGGAGGQTTERPKTPKNPKTPVSERNPPLNFKMVTIYQSAERFSRPHQP